MYKRKEILLISLFVLSVIASIIGVLMQNESITNTAVVVEFSLLVLMYVVLVKKINYWVVVHLVLMLLAELFLLYKGMFLFSMMMSAIAQIVLIKLIIDLKHIKFYDSVFYFLVTVLGYIVIYVKVLDVRVGYGIVFYGVTNALVVALGMANHLKKMYLANYLLFLGVAFWVLNNAILSLNVFDVHSNIFGLITNSITHFCITYSFVVRVNRLPKKKRILE